MGGSTDGPDPYPIRYSTVHRLEVPLQWRPGGGLPADVATEAMAVLKTELAKYPTYYDSDGIVIEQRAPGEGALVAVVGVTTSERAPATFPGPLAEMSPGQRMDAAGGPAGDGMTPGAGFGRAGAG